MSTVRPHSVGCVSPSRRCPVVQAAPIVAYLLQLSCRDSEDAPDSAGPSAIKAKTMRHARKCLLREGRTKRGGQQAEMSRGREADRSMVPPSNLPDWELAAVGSL